MTTAIATQRTVADLIEEYEAKDAALTQAMASFGASIDALGMASTVQGCFVDTIVKASVPHESALRKNLLASGWKAVARRVSFHDVATAADKLNFEKTLASPPPLTMDNAIATFKDYLERPRFHILRGLAEVFTALDPAYKSHSNVKIGVKGLPKRIVLNGWGDFSYGYARDRFRDMINALATLQGKPHFEYSEMAAINFAHDRLREDAVLDGRSYFEPDRYTPDDPKKVKELKTVDRGLTLKKFLNGNVHVIFDKWAMLDINRALAEFYGDVLPDVEEETDRPQASTAVSKDLQFYWTPPEVVSAALDFAGISHPSHYSRTTPPEYRVLEPSCGDGRILDELRARGCRSLGVEYHAGRASEAKAKGHNVLCANFLDQPAQAEFDKVVMNPPFYGRHYVKHVNHALKFLKPGGSLVAILPASARYDHKELTGEWRDLPVASFAASGTNVPTTMLRIVKRGEAA